MGYYIIAVVPNVDMLQQYADLMAKMPPLLMKSFGLNDAAQLTTPGGFIGFGFFSYMLLVMATYAVIAGLAVTTGEEDRGIMDMLLSLPLPRWRVIVERVLAYTVVILIMLALGFAGLWVGQVTTPGLSLDLGRLFEGTVNLLPSTLLVLAFTVLVGTLARSRGTAVAIAATFVVASYFVDFIGAAASDTVAASLRVVSFYSWYNGGQIMFTGLELWRVLPLLVLAVVMVLISLWGFERRDVSV